MSGHKARPIAERFWEKVAPAPATECWTWAASLNATGYGKFKLDHWTSVLAHRWSYEAMRAPIPDGLTIDHLCRNRACVNPWHLEPVPIGVNRNRARRSHCQRGHAMVGHNVAIDRDGKRRCRACRAERIKSA